MQNSDIEDKESVEEDPEVSTTASHDLAIDDMEDKTGDSNEPADEEKGRCSFRSCCTPRRCALYTLPCSLIFFVSAVAITAHIMSQQYDADVPDIGYDQGSQSNLNQEVIVIGAGASGLFAGYTLKYLGVESFMVLEADDHIGGRAWQTDTFIPEVPLDLGAEWIHVDPRVLGDVLLFDDDLSKEENLPETIEYRPETFSAWRNDKLRRPNWARWFYSETKFFNTTWWGYLNNFAYSYIEDKVQLNSPVDLIDYSRSDAIRVVTKGGTEYFADKVIVAAPVSILHNEDIVFDPPVPDSKRQAWNSVEFPPGLKAWLEFDERFYPDMVTPGPIWNLLSVDKLYIDALFGKEEVTGDRNVMALFEVGATAESKVDMTEDEIIDDILEELDEMFDGKASEHLVQTLVQHWTQEPYIQGAYSYNRVNPRELQASIDSRIYFCGEYLADEWATVHGAAISGRNVIAQMIDDLQAQ